MTSKVSTEHDQREECHPWLPQPAASYSLRGPQVEPEAGFWTIDPCKVPCVIRIVPDLTELTDNPDDPCYFPDYPTNPAVTDAEIQELRDLAQLRDDPEAVASNEPGRTRLALSPFLQLRPQPIGAVFNRLRPDSQPVIRIGRELARYFEMETPGLARRHALNFLIRDTDWSPPRQARVWAALDVTIYRALLAAWHYKWFTDRAAVRYRPRPIEADYRISVLYNRAPNATQSGDGEQRRTPTPSPGTPRHPAYPSAHSTYAGAASELLSFFFPDWAAEFDMLADNTDLARLWAGIHWRSDHEQAMHLGRCVARQVIKQLQASCICPLDPCTPPDPCEQPPTHDALRDAADKRRACCEQKTQDSDANE